jgi:hypothetical protein
VKFSTKGIAVMQSLFYTIIFLRHRHGEAKQWRDEAIHLTVIARNSVTKQSMIIKENTGLPRYARNDKHKILGSQ